MNVIEYACQMQDAKLAALKAVDQVPSAEAIKVATLAAILRVQTDPLGWCCRDDVYEAIELAWKRLEAGDANL
uniref:hypothetical protein n=1 Tax=Cyanobium sp. TaxID=2164130 RepID=UPI004047658E